MSVVSGALWLAAPRVEYLVPGAIATGASLLLVPSLRRAQRRWALACGALLTALLVLAAMAQAELARVNGAWNEWRVERERSAAHTLTAELDRAAASLTRAAQAALDAPPDAESAFPAIERAARELGNGPGERGLVLMDTAGPIAWSGRLRALPDSMRDSLGISVSPFYVTLYAAATRGERRAVAMVLLDASPPADRMATSLARVVADRERVSGFWLQRPDTSAAGDSIVRFAPAGRPLFEARALPLLQGEVSLRLRERALTRAAVVLAAALACFIVAVWRRVRRTDLRLAALLVALGCAALVPLNVFSNVTRLFDPALYFTSLGGPLTANAGALGLTSAVALLAVLAVFRRYGRRPSRRWAVVIVVAVAGLGPFLLRDLSRGIQTPSFGIGTTLWLMWEVPLFLAAVSVLLAGAGAGGVVLGKSRGLPPVLAPALAAAAATIGPVVWQAPGQWPWWYTFLWIAAIGALALSRQTRYVVITAASVAALGAATLVWGRTARGRVALAERDLQSLSSVDPYASALVERFGERLRLEPTARSRAELLQQFVTSDLAAAGYPAVLFAWPSSGGSAAVLRTAPMDVPVDTVLSIAREAAAGPGLALTPLASHPAAELVLAARGVDGGVTALVTAPKTRLIARDPFAALLGLSPDPELEPPYTVQLADAPAVALPSPPTWRREGTALHGDWVVSTGAGASRAHVEVELRSLDALVQRGALVVLLDLAFVGLLWFVSVLADGGVGRWLMARRRTWGRSFRARLSLALFGFFVVPALAFAIWSYGQLSSDALQSRDLLVRETLRAVAPSDSAGRWVAGESDRLDTPLFLYRAGELREASDSLYVELAPFGRMLRPDVDLALRVRDEVTASHTERVLGGPVLVGYRVIEAAQAPGVIGAPARADELTLSRRRRDLGILVLFATAVGALAALWLSGIAARQLARPIGSLRRAALALAGGERKPALESEPTVEFQPVFTAFERMASDLNASRTALEEAQRRTSTVLRNAASGVVAVDTQGRVTLANPQADALVGAPLPPGTDFAAAAPREIAERVLSFLRGTADEDAFELELGERQLRGRLARLSRGGVVVTLDDVTALAHAQRVLAWGEMARQVAHEIKNPLTPIRLGVQHLKRARADRRVDFDRVLDQNVERILAEIDRLDEIARSFSRYGEAPEERLPAEPTDVAAVVRDVVALESMATEDAVQWKIEGADMPVMAMARPDQLRDVLLNVFENARLADARAVTARVVPQGPRVLITVRDDGHGIPEQVLPRVFEPHFSTRTSGSGLGLAISRRLIEGWVGEMTIASVVGQGTTVDIHLASAPA